jgi:DNA topoisomerase-1
MTRPIGAAGDEQGGESGDRELGMDPATGHAIWLKNGRFGPYVEETATPVKRASLPKDWPQAAVDLDRGLRLLRLPREVGPHPSDGAMILAGVGRYGPYVQHNGVYANLPTADEVFDLGINRAVAVLAEKAAGGGRRPRAATARELGAHPVTGEPVRLLSGRFGPYVKHGAINANLPRGADPDAITLDEAVALIAAREGAGDTGKSKLRRGATAKRKAPAKARPARAKAKTKA